MKNLFRFSLFILINCLINVTPLKTQDWPCGTAATNNINIPDQNSNVYCSENSVAVHPLNPNIILCANNHNVPNQVSAFVSTNWGMNWSSPFTRGIFDPNSGYDPAAGIDLNGRLYVSYISAGGSVQVAYSNNLGSNWTLITVYNTNSADKDHFHIDNSCNSAYKGRLYCSWLQGSNSIKMSFSDDGINWSSPQTLSNTPYLLDGVNIATDNSGNIYVVWEINNGNGYWNNFQFTKSTNGGVNWSTPAQISLQYTAHIQVSAVGPSMSVNMQDNTIFLVYSGAIPPAYNNYDVYMKKSTNGGINWSNELTINQIQTGFQTFPWISCDPISGYLACIYYDNRYGDKHTYVSISTNSGSSWCDMRVSSVPWNGPAYGVGNDYIGVEINKGIVYPVWTDTRGDGGVRTYTYPYDVIPKDLAVHDQTFSGNNSPIQSANTITAYNITISSGANAIFQTVKSIVLEPGFFTNEDCHFTAELFQCQSGSNLDNIVQKDEVKPTTSKQKDNTVPSEFSLKQNYPNPFNPSTLIKYALKENSEVKIIVYSILGQEVKKLVDEYEYEGYRSVIWDGNNDYGMPVSSGIYLYKITAGNFSDKKKMVLIR